MAEYSKKIWNLIITVLTDEATMQERQMLEKWLAENPDHRTFYNKLKQTWNKTSAANKKDSPSFNYERGLSRLRKKITEKEQPKIHQLSTSERKKSKNNAWKVAASLLLLVVSLSVFVTTQFWENPTQKYTTAEKERQVITLPDGSRVHLNKNSEIEYPENFTADMREVTLHGEAFFEVEDDEKRPFKIYLDHGTVEVLGTSFSVKEMSRFEETMVAVKEGLVSLSANKESKGNEVRLKAGQVGLLDVKSSRIMVEDTNVQNYFSWVEGKLSFRGMDMEQVCTQLGRMYEVRCELQDESLKELQLTVYTENLALDDVLNTMAISLDIQYERSGTKIVWSTK